MTTFTPPHPNPDTPDKLFENHLAALRAKAITYHQVGQFVPITHWAELTKEAEK